jgi:hypothetical protein
MDWARRLPHGAFLIGSGRGVRRPASRMSRSARRPIAALPAGACFAPSTRSRNHDWYDGQSASRDLFTRAGRSAAGKPTNATTSRSTAHRWWLTKVDVQLESASTSGNSTAPRSRPLSPRGARIILASAEPDWLYLTSEPDAGCNGAPRAVIDRQERTCSSLSAMCYYRRTTRPRYALSADLAGRRRPVCRPRAGQADASELKRVVPWAIPSSAVHVPEPGLFSATSSLFLLRNWLRDADRARLHDLTWGQSGSLVGAAQMACGATRASCGCSSCWPRSSSPTRGAGI